MSTSGVHCRPFEGRHLVVECCYFVVRVSKSTLRWDCEEQLLVWLLVAARNTILLCIFNVMEKHTLATCVGLYFNIPFAKEAVAIWKSPSLISQFLWSLNNLIQLHIFKNECRVKGLVCYMKQWNTYIDKRKFFILWMSWNFANSHELPKINLFYSSPFLLKWISNLWFFLSHITKRGPKNDALFLTWDYSDGYRFFCMFVAARYIAPRGSGVQENEFFSQKGPKRFTRADYKKLTKEDRQKMQKRIDEAREKLEEAFTKLPSELFLVLR